MIILIGIGNDEGQFIMIEQRRSAGQGTMMLKGGPGMFSPLFLRSRSLRREEHALTLTFSHQYPIMVFI